MGARMAWLAGAALGCGGVGDLAVDVALGPEGPVFSWDGGPVTVVTVTDCGERCRCTHSDPLVGEGFLFVPGATVWQVGIDVDTQDEDERAAWEDTPGVVESPLLYGVSPLADRIGWGEAGALEPGRSYGVLVEYDEPCLLDGDGCVQRVAAGCALFDAK